MVSIGYMGIAGSFSDVAAHELVKKMGWEEVQYLPLVCSQNILDKLKKGLIDYGVLGVENSSVGAVSEFAEAFSGVEYEVISEYILPIHHCLFKLNADIPAGHLKTVASHPQAITQTAKTRAARWPSLKEYEIDDTALGAEWLSSGILPDTTAVICSRAAGQMWGLDLIAENIEDSATNRTVFWLLKLR